MASSFAGVSFGFFSGYVWEMASSVHTPSKQFYTVRALGFTKRHVVPDHREMPHPLLPASQPCQLI
jgi:hypothetical protein